MTQLFRVIYKATGGHAGSFMSAPLTISKAEELAAELKTDPNIYAVKIVVPVGTAIILNAEGKAEVMK